MTAIVSFTIALLPFFDPIEADIKKYETTHFGNNDKETSDYLEVFAKDRVFRSLAWYCLTVGMSFRNPTLLHGLTKMAKAFATEPAGDPGVETSLRGIHHAITSWRPFVNGKQISKATVGNMAQAVVNMLLVEYARNDPAFDVSPIS
jgi:hypothetical protein